MWRSLKRVERQVRKSNYFDVISINDETNLDACFREQFKGKLVEGVKGFGYWVWKPQIILQTLRQMKECDLLLYMDAGCHFNKHGIKRLNEYFEIAIQSPTGMVVFQEAKESENKNLAVGILLESMWTKGDVFDFFSVRDNKEIYATGQMVGGIHVIKKCKESENIFSCWLDVFKYNFNLIDDSPSVSPNFPDFIRHRHDQSIISIICKKNNIPSISAAELWQKDWKKLKAYPILAKRDKDLGFLMWMKQKIKGVHRRINGAFKNIKNMIIDRKDS